MSWKKSSLVIEARRENFPLMSRTSSPGVPFSTRKPRNPSSVRAHTIARSAIEPFVIQLLLPFRIQRLPSRTALVRIPRGLDPKSASVRPKHPMASPAAILGSHRSFCSSEP
jgi:hypothetical protein